MAEFLIRKKFLLKILSLFSLTRGYNIIFIIFAQFVSSIFIFSNSDNILDVLFDVNIWFIILSTSTSISAGYIINNFYDSEKDLINRPLKTILENEISGRTKLIAYTLLNFCTLLFSLLVSLKALIFFSFYTFGIFIYSIKLSKYLFIGNFLSVILVITPFFAITVYYKNFSLEILTHAIFLFFVILIKELIKDLENLKGDFTMKYRTIPVIYGENLTKSYITMYVFFVIATCLNLIINYDISLMIYYYVLSIPFFLFFIGFLWKFQNINHYQKLHNSLKVIITLGLFSIILHGY
ncbi:MAG: ubiquinone biosynthesis protein UbiA [Cryomorphaceae bacterium]|nr:MAG: ubiquinone biosynthesis protein UbiA [Cryomorphaceae bacterium]|tara:strand:- start:472 stop:1356 length:885 start_codon:yes stop_codon:yes gene_type:complete